MGCHMEKYSKNKRVAKLLITVDDTFRNCLIEPVTENEWPYSDHTFLKVKEKGRTYLVNVDYVMTIEF